MARLNNPLLLQHGDGEPKSERAAGNNRSSERETRDESDDDDVELLDRSSSPPMPNLTTRVLSKEDLEHVTSSTDLNQFLGTSDLQRALDLGRQIIVARSKVAETVNLQCAWDISVVWRMIGKLEVARPRAKAVITKWRHEIGRQLQNDSKDIDYYLGLADITLSQLSDYTKRIYDRWGILPTQVLPKDKYSGDRPPSKGVIQAMAQLADHVSREEGRELILKEINRRCNENTRVKYDRREPYLVPADIKAVMTSKKRPLDDTESDAKSAAAGAERKPAKRQRLGSVEVPDLGNADGGDGDASRNGAPRSPSNRSQQQSTPSPASRKPAEKYDEAAGKDNEAAVKDDVKDDEAAGKDGEAAKAAKAAEKDDETAEKDDEPTEKDDEQAGKDDEPTEKDDEPAGKDDEPAHKDEEAADKNDDEPPFVNAPETPQRSRPRRHSNDIASLPDGSTDMSIEMARRNATPLPDFESPELPIGDDTTKDNEPAEKDDGPPFVNAPETPQPSRRQSNAIASLPDSESPELPVADDTTLRLRSLKRSIPPSPFAGTSRRLSTSSLPLPLLGAADSPVVLDDDPSNVDSASLAFDGKIDTSSLCWNKKLSSTVIQQSLAYFLPADCHIIDPLYFDSAFPDRCSLKRQLDESIRRIFIPLHDAQLVHWRLAVLDLHDSSLTIFDSCCSGEIDGALTRRLQSFAEGVASGQQAWTTQWEACPQQSNGVDCGIHVIANAFFLMANNALPDSHDCDVWRLICKSLIGNDGTERVRVDDLPLFRCRISANATEAGIPAAAPQGSDDADTSAINLKQLNQRAQQYLSVVQAQERKLRKTLGSTAAMIEVMDELRRQQSLEVSSLFEQHYKDEKNLEEHDALIDQYDKFIDKVSSNNAMTQSALSAMRATHVKDGRAEKGFEGFGLDRRPLIVWREALASHLAKMVDRRKTLGAGLLRLKRTVQVARQITDSCKEQLRTVESAKTDLRRITQGWRDLVANTLQGFDMTLTCISKPEVDTDMSTVNAVSVRELKD